MMHSKHLQARNIPSRRKKEKQPQRHLPVNKETENKVKIHKSEIADRWQVYCQSSKVLRRLLSLDLLPVFTNDSIYFKTSKERETLHQRL